MLWGLNKIEMERAALRQDTSSILRQQQRDIGIMFTKLEMLMSILLHDERTVKQYVEEDDHCARAQQEHAP